MFGLNFGESESNNQQDQSSHSTSESDSHSSSSPVDLTPQAFQNLQGPLAQILQGMFSGGTTPQGSGLGGQGAAGQWAQYGQNNLAVPITANETNLLNRLMQDAAGASGRQGLIADTLAGKYVDPKSNPFLNDYIKAAQRNTLEGLTETLDRTLPGRFTQAGQFVNPKGSSAFDRAAAIATRGATNAMADIATNIGYNAYQGERKLQQEAIGISQQETQTTIANLTAQALPRVIQQYGVDKGLDLFKTQIASVLDALKTAAGLAQPTIGQESESSSSSESHSESEGHSTGGSSSWNAGIQLGSTTPGVG